MRRLAIISVVFLAACGTAVAQDSAPPVIDDVEWQISRYVGGNNFLDWYDPYEAFDPLTDIAHEKDLILLTITVSDGDFSGEEGDGLYYLIQTDWLPVNGYASPEPAPVGADLIEFFPDDEGMKPAAGTTLIFDHIFEVPSFAGRNQAHLRGYINYDVRWLVRLLVSNEEDPTCTSYIGQTLDVPCEAVVDRWTQILYAIENPVLGAPNPPPFADAGADQEVEAGTITLDGSRSIDLYNIGFNSDSGNVIDRDTLSFTWEWQSGPQRVDPVQADPHEPTATVALVLPGTYQYRLTVDDNINALPSTDLVTIVVTTLETNVAPKARITTDPEGKTTWIVGETVTLSAATSTDANAGDADEFRYTWRQTDELGGEIPADSLREIFQPISGMQGATAEWQALEAGTYYFRLLVTDPDGLADSERFTVTVIDSAAAGASIGGDQNQDSPLAAPLLTTGACGAGVAPFALIPLAACALRRRFK